MKDLEILVDEQVDLNDGRTMSLVKGRIDKGVDDGVAANLIKEGKAKECEPPKAHPLVAGTKMDSSKPAAKPAAKKASAE